VTETEDPPVSPDAGASPASDPADGNTNAPTAPADGDASAEVTSAAAASAPADEATGDLVFDTLWTRVLAAWDDDKPHGALVEYALRTQRLPELAGKYKSLTSDPEKKVRAQKRLDGVVIAATHLLMATKSPPLPKSNKLVNVFAVLLLAVTLAYSAYWMIMSRRNLPP
jgi:hypothetical protein